jgi:shikimate dehydrogenase
VVDACLQDGALEVLVGGRRAASARALVEEFGDERLTAVTLGPEFDARLAGVDLAVNATTVGMTSPGVAFDPSQMTTGASLFDLVYVPAETPLLAAAREAGVPAVNGAGMLVAQAEIAFERWTGQGGAGSIMRAALEPLLNGQVEA